MSTLRWSVDYGVSRPIRNCVWDYINRKLDIIIIRMKANLEAWQLGYEDGWDDGFNDLQPKENVKYPENWTDVEMSHYKKGYSEGYSEGTRNG